MRTLPGPRAAAACLLAAALVAGCGGPTSYTGNTMQQALARMTGAAVTVVEQVPTVYPQLTAVIYTTPTDAVVLALPNDPTPTFITVVKHQPGVWSAYYADPLSSPRTPLRPCSAGTTVNTVDFIQPSTVTPPVLVAVGRFTGPAHPWAVRVDVTTLRGGHPLTHTRQAHIDPMQPFWVVTFPFQVDGRMTSTPLAADGSVVPACG